MSNWLKVSLLHTLCIGGVIKVSIIKRAQKLEIDLWEKEEGEEMRSICKPAT